MKGINVILSIFMAQNTFNWQHLIVSKTIPVNYVEQWKTKDILYPFPTYSNSTIDYQDSYKESSNQTLDTSTTIIKQVEKNTGLSFLPDEKAEGNVCFINSPELRDDYKTTFTPADLLDYIYAVLHSSTYRKKHKEFLKIDFSRVSYPKDSKTFCQLVQLGKKIRKIHLQEWPHVEEYTTSYPKDGSNTITREFTKTSPGFEPNDSSVKEEAKEIIGKVWINDAQYFDQVPLIAWEFHMSGNRPAQKWLKDRKGRTLSHDDILHYQKIIVALTKTYHLTRKIDAIEIEE